MATTNHARTVPAGRQSYRQGSAEFSRSSTVTWPKCSLSAATRPSAETNKPSHEPALRTTRGGPTLNVRSRPAVTASIGQRQTPRSA